MTDGHFAIRVLRGEEYFVVIENLPVETAAPSTRATSSGRSPSWPTGWKIGSRGAVTCTEVRPARPRDSPASQERARNDSPV